MLSFNQIQENENGNLPFLVAKSTPTTHFYIIEMDLQNVSVSFTKKSKTNITSDKVWLSTVTGMNGNKGGYPIKDINDQLAKTIATITDLFIREKRASAILMRVSKKQSGRRWDSIIRRSVRDYQLLSDSTNIINNEATNTSYFIIHKSSYTPVNITDVFNLMSTEIEPSSPTKSDIKKAAIDFPNQDMFSIGSVEKYTIDNPPRKVNKYNTVDIPDVTLDQRVIDKSVAELRRVTQPIFNAAETSSEENAIEKMLSNGVDTLNSTDRPEKIASKLMANYSEFSNKKTARDIINEVTKQRDHYIVKQYTEMVKKNDFSALDTSEKNALSEWTYYESGNINKAILKGNDHPYIEHIDSAFAKIGGVMAKNTLLYRGMATEPSKVLRMIESKTFSTLGYMSTTTSQRTATLFAEYKDNGIVNDRKDNADAKRVFENTNVRQVGVVFIIDTTGLPVMIPIADPSSLVVDETEILINRGTGFTCEFINCSDDGSHAVFKLKVVNKNAYTESVLGMAESKRINEYVDLANILGLSDLQSSEKEIHKNNMSLI